MVKKNKDAQIKENKYLILILIISKVIHSFFTNKAIKKLHEKTKLMLKNRNAKNYTSLKSKYGYFY